jgi:hypothetical protein
MRTDQVTTRWSATEIVSPPIGAKPAPTGRAARAKFVRAAEQASAPIAARCRGQGVTDGFAKVRQTRGALLTWLLNANDPSLHKAPPRACVRGTGLMYGRRAKERASDER